MRETKFRGLYSSGANRRWVYGDLVRDESRRPIIRVYPDYFGNDDEGLEYVYEDCYVDPESVGQYTGLKDKNGLTEVFEGDVVEGNLFDRRVPIQGYVFMDEEHGCWALKNDGGITFLFKIAELCVIGNVHENQELLKV